MDALRREVVLVAALAALRDEQHQSAGSSAELSGRVAELEAALRVAQASAADTARCAVIAIALLLLGCSSVCQPIIVQHNQRYVVRVPYRALLIVTKT